MTPRSLPPRVVKGLSDGLFTVEVDRNPTLTHELNDLLEAKRAGPALMKLAEIPPGTEIRIGVPTTCHSPLLPAGFYGFLVGSESEWRSPLIVESLACECLCEATQSPNVVLEIAARALRQATPQAEAAAKALAAMANPTLAAVLATACRKQELQVYGGMSPPVSVPVEFVALPLILRRALEPAFSAAVREHQKSLHALAGQEMIQEIAPGIGFRVAPAPPMVAAHGNLREIRKAYLAAAWAFSDEYVRIVATSDTDHSGAKRLWRTAAALMNQLEGLGGKVTDATSKRAPTRNPIIEQGLRSFAWSLAWGVVSFVVALLVQVQPLLDVGGSANLSILMSALILAVAAPALFHVLANVGLYTIVALGVVFGSIGSIVAAAFSGAVHDQTTWIWLSLAPTMMIYEVFQRRAARGLLLEEWRRGVV